MTAPSSCPPAETLRQLLDAALPGEHVDLIAHLDDCAACRQTLEALTGVSPAVLGAARAFRSKSYASEGQLRVVLDDLGKVASWTAAHPVPHRMTWVRSMLRP